MLIVIDDERKQVVLEQADTLSSLSARCASPGQLIWLDPAVAYMDEDLRHVWISGAWMREAGARQATIADWGGAYDRMLSYAAKQGWVDAKSGFVRAHLETA